MSYFVPFESGYKFTSSVALRAHFRAHERSVDRDKIDAMFLNALYQIRDTINDLAEVVDCK